MADSHGKYQYQLWTSLCSKLTLAMRETGADIIPLQPRVGLEQVLRRVAGGQHSENVFDGQPVPANDRLSAEDRRIHGDALEEIDVRHAISAKSSQNALRQTITHIEFAAAPALENNFNRFTSAVRIRGAVFSRHGIECLVNFNALIR